MQEAAPGPLGGGRQVRVPDKEEDEEGECTGRTAGGESEHEERGMRTRVI